MIDEFEPLDGSKLPAISLALIGDMTPGEQARVWRVMRAWPGSMLLHVLPDSWYAISVGRAEDFTVIGRIHRDVLRRDEQGVN